MIDARSNASVGGAARHALRTSTSPATSTDGYVSLPVRKGGDPAASGAPLAGSPSTSNRSADRPDAKIRRVAAEIVRSVQNRLPGRVRDLKVRFEHDQFVLSGVSSSYYVKQVAQHLAMSALDAVMLGRLVNEIEVRSMR